MNSKIHRNIKVIENIDKRSFEGKALGVLCSTNGYTSNEVVHSEDPLKDISRLCGNLSAGDLSYRRILELKKLKVEITTNISSTEQISELERKNLIIINEMIEGYRNLARL